MTVRASKTCPECAAPMRALSRTGYFCRSCGAAVTLAEDGWVHVLRSDLSESWVRASSAGGGLLV